MIKTHTHHHSCSDAVMGVGIKKSVGSLSCDPIAQRTEGRDVMFYCVPINPKKLPPYCASANIDSNFIQIKANVNGV